MKTKIAKWDLSEVGYRLRKLKDTYSETSETYSECMSCMNENLKKEDLYEIQVFLRFMLMTSENFLYTVKCARDYVNHTIQETEVHAYQDTLKK